MARQLARLLMAIALVAGLFGISGEFGHAEPNPQSGQTQRYLPWVPYGEVISDPRGFPDSGPYYGVITVQNLESEQIKINAYPVDAETITPLPADFILGPGESRSYLPGSIFGEATPLSSGILVNAIKTADDSPARISAVMRQVSASMPANPAETTGAHVTVSGYTSLSYAGVAATPRVLPIVQTNSNWNTIIRLTNFQTNHDAAVTLQLRPSGAGNTIYFPILTIEPGKTHTLNLYEEVGADWVGHLYISTASHVGAVAERIKNETNMLMINTARSHAQTNEVQVAPLVFRNWNHWNTGISIVNLDSLPNDITVTYYSPEGGTVHVDEITVPGWDMDFIYMPAGQGQPFVGSAAIEGESTFIATVDEVKYFGEDGDTGHAMSYHADYLQAGPGQSLAIPLFRKGDPQTGGGDTSGVQIFNLFGQAAVRIRVIDSTGQSALSEPLVINLGPHEGYTFYSMEQDDLPVGFTGSVIIQNLPLEDQNSAVFAVSNLVNYDVQFDGSSAFNTRWYVTPPTEIVPPPVIIMP